MGRLPGWHDPAPFQGRARSSRSKESRRGLTCRERGRTQGGTARLHGAGSILREKSLFVRPHTVAQAVCGYLHEERRQRPSHTGKEIMMRGKQWLAWRGTSALKVWWAWLGSCCSLLLVAALDRFVAGDYGVPMLIGSFGASAVLLFAAPESPLSRPRNLLGGHFLSALVGVACAQWLPPFWAICLCVPTAIAVMLLSGTLHPPGGATALIAVTGGEQIRQLGFWYAVVPCLAGAALMLGTAWLLGMGKPDRNTVTSGSTAFLRRLFRKRIAGPGTVS